MKILAVQLPAEQMKYGNTLRMDNDASHDGYQQKATREIRHFKFMVTSWRPRQMLYMNLARKTVQTPSNRIEREDIPLKPSGYYMYH
jgi:hypothetical protein